MTQKEFTPPQLVSGQARRYFEENFSRSVRDAKQVPASDDVAGWERFNDAECEKQEPVIRELIERYLPTLIDVPEAQQARAKTCDFIHDHLSGK